MKCRGVTRAVPRAPRNHSKNFDHGSPLRSVLYKYDAAMHVATGSRNAMQYFTAGPVVHLLLE